MMQTTAQESQYARSLIEASLDPLFTISPAGKITDMNNASVNITGLTREQLINTDFFKYFTEPEKAREVYEEVFAKESVADSPLTLRHREGKLTDVLFNGSVYKDNLGSVLGVVIVARDITEQKRIARELLEAKVAAEVAAGLAEEAVNAKQQFLSNMSHEIRTPMNAIIGFTKVLMKTEMQEKQKEYVSAIKVSGEALTVLVNDILDLAKVDAGKMTFEQIPFKLETSLSAMLYLFETKILEKKLVLIKEFDAGIPEVLIGDPVRLRQIILNLVSNAVKFTSEGSITIVVTTLNEDEKSVTIEFAISDTGIGIAQEKTETIFDAFKQASSGTARLYGGTGLGLAIVKQLVEAQGGTMNVKSKIGEGSTFSFALSFEKTNGKAEADEGIVELDEQMKGIRVLLAEDIPLNQLLMKTVLNDYGFVYDIAANGKIAIEKMQTQTYDVVLMDLQMPEMNGFEATEYIRNTLNLKVPIIALTADVTTVDLAKCRAVGMNDYISKPVDEILLYNKIISVVKRPNMQDGQKATENTFSKSGNLKYVDLNSLVRHTKSDPKLMMETIALYLEQTPPLIAAMNQGLQNKDWNKLQSAVHKMVPSFSIMGISKDFENMAIKVQENVDNLQRENQGMANLVLQLELVCTESCKELEAEFNIIKNANS